MDLFTVGMMINGVIAKERFEDKPKEKENPKPVTMGKVVFVVILLILGFSVSCIAAYLSWSCNSALRMNTIEKVLYSIFSFIFGFFYLIFYLLFRSDVCYDAKNNIIEAY